MLIPLLLVNPGKPGKPCTWEDKPKIILGSEHLGDNLKSGADGPDRMHERGAE